MQKERLSSRRCIEEIHHHEGHQEIEVSNHICPQHQVDCETQTEERSSQRECANADGQETRRRLEEKNRKLSVLVEEYERKIVVLNEKMEHLLEDRKFHIHHIQMKCEEENERQLLKMRDMRNKLYGTRNSFPASVCQQENKARPGTCPVTVRRRMAERRICHPACKTENNG